MPKRSIKIKQGGQQLAISRGKSGRKRKHQMVSHLPHCLAVPNCCCGVLKVVNLKLPELSQTHQQKRKKCDKFKTATKNKTKKTNKTKPLYYLFSTHYKVSWKYELAVLCSDLYHLSTKLKTISTSTLNTPIAQERSLSSACIGYSVYLLTLF